MKRLQLHRLMYYYKVFKPWKCGFSFIRFWVRDIKSANERCAYCGWYLHAGMLFKGVERPMKLSPHMESTGEMVCAKCHYLLKEI